MGARHRGRGDSGGALALQSPSRTPWAGGARGRGMARVAWTRGGGGRAEGAEKGRARDEALLAARKLNHTGTLVREGFPYQSTPKGAS